MCAVCAHMAHTLGPRHAHSVSTPATNEIDGEAKGRYHPAQRLGCYNGVGGRCPTCTHPIVLVPLVLLLLTDLGDATQRTQSASLPVWPQTEWRSHAVTGEEAVEKECGTHEGTQSDR
jgi:hypothetical protein